MKQDLTASLALLAAFPAALGALLGPLPESLTQAQEGPGTWTVTQVIAHLIHGERTDWLPRIHIILRSGQSETFPAFQREAHMEDRRSLPELLNEFAALRSSNVAQLEELHLQPLDFELTGKHPTLGVVTLAELLATWPAHDLTHLHQIARIIAAQYRGAVGPWVSYLGVLQCNGHSAKA